MDRFVQKHATVQACNSEQPYISAFQKPKDLHKSYVLAL